MYRNQPAKLKLIPLYHQQEEGKSIEMFNSNMQLKIYLGFVLHIDKFQGMSDTTSTLQQENLMKNSDQYACEITSSV